jgi:hypothetical protein
MNKDLVLVLVESAKNAMPAGMTPDKWIEMYNERLVELVVRECIGIAKSWEDQLEEADSLDESNAVGIVAYRMARQFGVSV